jgi:hypothetical protein
MRKAPAAYADSRQDNRCFTFPAKASCRAPLRNRPISPPASIPLRQDINCEPQGKPNLVRVIYSVALEMQFTLRDSGRLHLPCYSRQVQGHSRPRLIPAVRPPPVINTNETFQVCNLKGLFSSRAAHSTVGALGILDTQAINSDGIRATPDLTA